MKASQPYKYITAVKNGKNYSHLEYNAKVNSAETIARVLGGKSEDKSDAEKLTTKETANKTTNKKSTAKTAEKAPSKKSGGRKKKSDKPSNMSESQVSTL